MEDYYIVKYVVHHHGYNHFRFSSLFHGFGTQKNTKVGSLENLLSLGQARVAITDRLEQLKKLEEVEAWQIQGLK